VGTRTGREGVLPFAATRVTFGTEVPDVPSGNVVPEENGEGGDDDE